MKYIDASFTATAGTTLGDYMPEVGASPVLRSGTDNAVITASNTVRGGMSGADSVYEFVQSYRGNLMDATFTLTCVTDEVQDITVWPNYSHLDNSGFYAGLRWGSQAQWVLYSGSGGSGGVQLVNANPVPGKSYNFRLRVNPYVTILYVDGQQIMNTNGSDWVGDPDIRSVAVTLSTNAGASDTSGWQLDNLRIWAGDPRPTSSTIPTALAPTYNDELMCLSVLVKIVRTDGTVFAFTTHDRSLTISGLKYEAMSAIMASSLRQQIGKDPDNMDMKGILNSDAITEDDMRNGLYDDAQITISECDWSNLSAGIYTRLQGVIGDLAISDGVYNATILSNLQIMERQIGRTVAPSCDVHQFGDLRCKIDVTGNTATGKPITSVAAITTINDDTDIEFATGIVTDAGFYTYGLITSTSGANIGLSNQIKLHGDKNTPDTPTAVASPLSTGNLAYKSPTNFGSSQNVTVAIPAGVWDTATLQLISTWSNIGLMTDPDILEIQIPPGQNNESTVRSTNAAATYQDTLEFNTTQLETLNAAAGSNLTIAYRHTSNTVNGAPFMHVSINSLLITLIGTAAGTSNRIVLQQEFPYPLSIGDTFSLQAGCDRVHTTCINKYANINNFRGFPALPGNNLLQQVGRGANTG